VALKAMGIAIELLAFAIETIRQLLVTKSVKKQIKGLLNANITSS
jgi:hypothetical protein